MTGETKYIWTTREKFVIPLGKFLVLPEKKVGRSPQDEEKLSFQYSPGTLLRVSPGANSALKVYRNLGRRWDKEQWEYFLSHILPLWFSEMENAN